MNAPTAPAGAAAVRRALNLLNRASADWRNGGGCDSGALHWPVAISFARRELCQALAALEVFGIRESRTDAGTGFEADGPCEFCGGAGRDSGPQAHVAGPELLDTEDARAGIAWWNSLTPSRRRHWLEIANSAAPADAWAAYKGGAAPQL